MSKLFFTFILLLINIILTSTLLFAAKDSTIEYEPYETIYFIVNQDIISKIDFEEEKKMNQSLQKLQRAEEGVEENSDQSIMSNLIVSTLMEQELTKAGVEISELDITNQIRNVMKANGIEDIDQFKQLLAAQGVTFASYYQFNKRQAIAQQFANKLLLVKQPTKEETLAYYNAHRDLFQITNTIVEVRMVLFLLDEDASFTERINREKKIQEILFEVTNSAAALSFAEAVLKYSEDNRSKLYQGNLGWITYFNAQQKGLSAANLLTLRDYEVGQVTAVISTLRGLAFFKISDKKKKGYFEFKDVKDRIQQILFLKKQKEALAKKVKNIMLVSTLLPKSSKFKDLINKQ